MTTEQERIWALLEKADTLEAVIALEERLSEIRYQLESMESQLKLYDNQVDYSTVSIHISEVAVYTPTGSQSVGTRIQDGFKRNLTSVKTAVVDLFVLVASTLPIWLPAILVFAAAAAGIRYYIGRNSSGEKEKKDEKPKKKLDDLRPGGTPPRPFGSFRQIKKHGAAKGNFDPLQCLIFIDRSNSLSSPLPPAGSLFRQSPLSHQR